MDGKQARKTGNSTTLGSLFDHGCDVMNLSLTCITVMNILGLSGLEFYCLVGFITLSFSVPIIEQLSKQVQNRQTRLRPNQPNQRGANVCRCPHLLCRYFRTQFPDLDRADPGRKIQTGFFSDNIYCSWD